MTGWHVAAKKLQRRRKSRTCRTKTSGWFLTFNSRVNFSSDMRKTNTNFLAFHSGLYKIKYDRRNYKLIVKALNGKEFKTIHTINRAQLIDDAMDLAWTGQQVFNVIYFFLVELISSPTSGLRNCFCYDKLSASRKRIHSMEGSVG